jgi:hypothetical protein
MKIDRTSHPFTYEALREMAYDNGAVNRLEPEAQSYMVPERFVNALPSIERALSTLTVDELTVFVGGSEGDARAIYDGNDPLAIASDLLDAVFNGEGQGDARGSR